MSPAGIYTGVSSNDGVERVIAYQKLDRYPIYVRFALGTTTSYPIATDARRR